MVLNRQIGHIGSAGAERAAKVTIPVQDRVAAGAFFTFEITNAGLSAEIAFFLTNLPPLPV